MKMFENSTWSRTRNDQQKFKKKNKKLLCIRLEYVIAIMRIDTRRGGWFTVTDNKSRVMTVVMLRIGRCGRYNDHPKIGTSTRKCVCFS